MGGHRLEEGSRISPDSACKDDLSFPLLASHNALPEEDVTMENHSGEQELDSTSVSVFQISGEPAVAINGLPDVAPGPGSPTQLDPCDPESNDEPCFGEWMEGREVQKMFGDRYYSGKVTEFDKEMKWYRVVYEDGDFEDLDWHELEEVLLPLDISIPLRKLALRTFKHGKSVKESGMSINKSRKCYSRNVRSMDKTIKLLKGAACTKSKGKMEANVHHKEPSEGLVNVDVVELGGYHLNVKGTREEPDSAPPR